MAKAQQPAAAEKAKKAAPRTTKRRETPSNASKSQATPTGRPSSFTQEIGDSICEALADGISLRKICLSEDMPSKSTVFRWLADEAYASFRDQYAQARETQADSLFDEIVEIADTPMVGRKTKTDAKGVEVTEADMIEHRRLQVEARKWVVGKLKPKKYGDKLELSGDADSPLVVEIVRHGTNPAPK